MDHESARYSFFAESEELLNDMTQALVSLERRTEPDHIHRLFRAAHTIKGNSRLFPFPQIETFAHCIEELLEGLRAGQVGVTKPVLDLLLQARDHLAVLVAHAAEGDAPDQLCMRRGAELADALRQFGDSGCAEPVPLCDDAFPVRWRVEWGIGPEVTRKGLDPLAVLRHLRSDGCIESQRLSGGLPALTQLDPERCYLSLGFDYLSDLPLTGIRKSFDVFLEESTLTITRADAPGGDAGARTKTVQTGPERSAFETQPKTRRTGSTEAAVRVDATRLEQLVNLVGELVIANAASNVLASRLGNEELAECNSAVTRLVEDIRDSALTLRMVPVAESFDRFKGVAVDMGRELGKSIEFTVVGGDVELDKTVVEKIGVPLMHLVRNAIDHGVETPAERVALGKPAKGTVKLAAVHQTGSVLIEVVDDGRGMDLDKLLARARIAGLVGEDENPGEQEIMRLAFEPGMSTADQVSSFSGRGVGLDAVKSKVESLRGTVELRSEGGKGTTVSIRLPLTLSIIDGFRVGVAGLSYVLPLDTVIECIEVEPGAARLGERHYINLRGEVLPFVRLRELFGEPEPGRDARENILVVCNGGQKAGLVVDELLGEYQTVIKPLGRLFRKAHGLSGATILGSGEVALILDVAQLIQSATGGRHDRLRESA